MKPQIQSTSTLESFYDSSGWSLWLNLKNYLSHWTWLTKPACSWSRNRALEFATRGAGTQGQMAPCLVPLASVLSGDLAPLLLRVLYFLVHPINQPLPKVKQAKNQRRKATGATLSMPIGFLKD